MTAAINRHAPCDVASVALKDALPDRVCVSDAQNGTLAMKPKGRMRSTLWSKRAVIGEVPIFDRWVVFGRWPVNTS